MQVAPGSERDLAACNHTGNQPRDCLSTSPSQNRSLLAAANQTDSLDRDENLAKTEILVLGVIFLVAVIGNLAVLLALCKTKRKMSRMHLFIRHLSMADLVVAVLQVLPQFIWDITYRFKGPDSLCRIVKHLQLFSMYASTYMTVMMSVDRYIAICHPLKTLQKPTKRSHRMIVATWLGSLLLSVPQYFIFSVNEVEKGSGVYDCWARFVPHWGVKTYITWITIAVFIIPVLVMVACYSCICCSIFRNIKYKTKKTEAGTSFENGQISIGANNMKTISKAKVRTVKMTLVIVVVYMLCWAPFFTAQMWSVWDNNSPKDDSTDALFTLTMLLASLNSCCNPWIYMFFSGHLLSDIIHSFPCCCKVTQKLEDSEGSIKQDTLLTKVSHRSSTASSYNWKDSVTSP
ncbi:arginine vasopressin receptor 1Aa isoform X2 [Pristis pectinata]|uniref:arginine vasopressin receptor 1Aa isoform X2 n=1 Tax=Pristis pectinata TaxID=685728 RepID=UPI00223D6BF1|nr:arginine vasopressin receptor 1Aa isoform X2 [Pristis pectinata]